MSDPHQPEVPGESNQPAPGSWTVPPPYQPAPHPSGLSPDELTWGSAAHWSSIVAMIVFLAFLGPLIVLLTKGNESPYVRRQAVESLNFQLSWLIYGLISLVLVIVLIGIVMLLVLGILWLVFTIVASVQAANGQEYRYPMTIRMVR